MDVLQPQLYWIENRCYRKNPLDPTYSSFQKDTFTGGQKISQAAYQEDIYNDEGACSNEVAVTQLANGKLQTFIDVPSALYPYIIGSKGSTKKKIENETKTSVVIPKPGQQGVIVITGLDRGSVIAAHNRVEILAVSARKKQQFTHFISIPVTSDNVKINYANFKREILQKSNAKDIDEGLFQNENKLHLTIATLVLLDDSERKKAAEVLQSCQEKIKEIVNGKELEVHVIGLEYMNDDPSQVDVLYGKVSDSTYLQEVADLIVQQFVDSGLMDRQYDKVKLHVTLMNSLFKMDSSGEDKLRPKFNATKILKDYKDFDFGHCTVRSIHLSQRYSTDQSGYYVATAKLDLARY